jgi:hypothetical protein
LLAGSTAGWILEIPYKPMRRAGVKASRAFRAGHRFSVEFNPSTKELNASVSDATAATEAPTKNANLVSWVSEIAELTQPDSIHWCDGSAEEYDRLCQQMVEAGTFEKLSDAKRPNS